MLLKLLLVKKQEPLLNGIGYKTKQVFIRSSNCCYCEKQLSNLEEIKAWTRISVSFCERLSLILAILLRWGKLVLHTVVTCSTRVISWSKATSTFLVELTGLACKFSWWPSVLVAWPFYTPCHFHFWQPLIRYQSCHLPPQLVPLVGNVL